MIRYHPVDFATVDMESGWEHPSGYAKGVTAKILADTLDENRRTGHRTLLQRYAPGVVDMRVLTHDFVEEVLVLEGELLWLDEEGGTVGRLPKHSYVCRPPHVPHGPFGTENGCLVLAVFYYS